MKNGKTGTDTIIINNMKYIEELSIGDCFAISSSNFIITTDFKKNGQRLCVNLKDGSTKWFEPNASVDNIDIFTLDKDNNVIAMKQREKENVPN